MADPVYKPLIPGNRMLMGESGIPFEAPATVASGLVRVNADIHYVDVEAAPAAPAPAEKPAPPAK